VRSEKATLLKTRKALEPRAGLEGGDRVLNYEGRTGCSTGCSTPSGFEKIRTGCSTTRVALHRVAGLAGEDRVFNFFFFFFITHKPRVE